MSQTDRSPLLKANDRNKGVERTQMSFNNCRKKGISLSKQLKKDGKDRSPSFIKLSNKGNKSFVVEKREIKLLIRGKEERNTTAGTNRFPQDRQNEFNWMNQAPFGIQIPHNKAVHFVPSNRANYVPCVQSNALPFTSKKKNQLTKHPLPYPPFPTCTPNPKRTTLKLL